MQKSRKKAAKEVEVGQDLQFLGRVLLAIDAVVGVIGGLIEREGESKMK